MPSYSKPSKYQLHNNVKAKVFTGLGDHLSSGTQPTRENGGVGNSQESNTNIGQNEDDDEKEDQDGFSYR